MQWRVSPTRITGAAVSERRADTIWLTSIAQNVANDVSTRTFRRDRANGKATSVRRILRTVLALCAIAAIMPRASAQPAPALNYTSYEAIPGKALQIGYYGSANRNCTPAALPTIRVMEAPQSGTLTVRVGSLTTDGINGCPRLKLPVQILFYLARPGVAGRDHLLYTVTSQNGEVGGYDVTIKINPAPKGDGSSPGKSI